MEQIETKICNKCGQELPITDFYFRDKAKGTRRGECKYCHCKKVKEDYKKKREEFNEVKKQCKCAKCGDTRSYVLDFHHIDPKEKSFTIGYGSNHNYNKETLEKEIAKCIPLCANCHREFHYLEKEKNITLDDFLTS